MSSERDIQRALKWNKENTERHKQAIKHCNSRLYKESWNYNIYDFKFPEAVEILDYHRCRFNGISYHVGIGGHLIANKYIGKDAKGKYLYEAHKLHRDLFMYYNNMEIPKGFQVHHVDGDVTNNLVSNLLCVSENQHKILHGKKVRA